MQTDHDLVATLVVKFGFAKTITFCELNSYFYGLSHMRNKEENPNEFSDDDYSSEWWSKKAEELKIVFNEDM